MHFIHKLLKENNAYIFIILISTFNAIFIHFLMLTFVFLWQLWSSTLWLIKTETMEFILQNLIPYIQKGRLNAMQKLNIL